jgi:8-oxo-dGTP pyrophosphatase MutT (NUDIX family)
MVQAAIVIVQNKNKELLVHKRSAQKKRFPNLYGLGAGGKVEDDENSQEAAKRELYEELGIKANIKFLFSCKYEQMVLHIYFTQYDGAFTPCNREFSSCQWMSTKEVNALEKNNELCPDTAMFYQMWKEKKKR